MTEQQVGVEDFQAEVGAFLEANAARKQQVAERGFVWGEGDDSVAMFEEVDPDTARAAACSGATVQSNLRAAGPALGTSDDRSEVGYDVSQTARPTPKRSVPTIAGSATPCRRSTCPRRPPAGILVYAADLLLGSPARGATSTS